MAASVACRSHYWIRNSRVEWSGQWSQAQIDAGFARDVQLKDDYYAKGDTAEAVGKASDRAEGDGDVTGKRRWWPTLKKKLSGRGKKR